MPINSSSNRNNTKQQNDSKSDDASKLIRENMKCPVCLEVLLPPIYQCETGHNICYLCVEEVSECPLCKSDYGDTRNYFAEELVNSMTFPCKYEEYGCKKTFLGSELKEHQENCKCQPYRCPELACQEVVGIHQMGKHLDKHGFVVMKGDVHQASLEILDDHFDRKTEYNPWRIAAFNTEFYTVTTRGRDGLWYLWTYGLGAHKDLRKFSYEIVLYSDEKQFMFREVVQSLRTTPEDIMKGGTCLITTDNVIKSIRKDGRIKCQVYLIHGKKWENSRNREGKGGVHKGKANGCKGCGFTTITPNKPSVHPNITKQSEIRQKRSRSNSLLSATRSSRSVSDSEHHFVDKVRETLRCPGCNDVITPPVFQCMIGHNVCHKCKSVRQDCPLCRAPLGDTRNFFAEELLYKTFQRCVYAKHGCKVCLPSAQMRSHELICDFAPFECPFNVCRALLSADDMFKHLQSHQIVVVEKELKGSVAVPRNAPSAPVCTIPNILKIDKIPFYPVIVRDTDGSWVFYVITQNHNGYRYELLIKKQHKTLAFQGPVLSLRTNHTQVKLKGQALVVNEKSIKCFKSNDKISYQIKVSKTDIGNSVGASKSSFQAPSTWVMTPKDVEVLSKAELFANKKTSITPSEESDDDTIPQNATAEAASASYSEVSESEDIEPSTESENEELNQEEEQKKEQEEDQKEEQKEVDQNQDSAALNEDVHND